MRKAETPELTAGESSGDPAVVAVENLLIHTDREQRPIGKPRASGLYKCCIRMHALGNRYDLSERKWADFSWRITYGIGNAVHYWIQNAPDILGDKRRGWWRCTACGRVRYFGAPPKARCEICNARAEATIYHEHGINISHPLAVTGHPDMFLEQARGIYRVLEIKTIARQEFLRLVAPLIEHLWQVEVYAWACKQKASKLPVKIDDSLSYILYVAKQHLVKPLPVKMFPVEHDPNVLRRALTKLREYRRSVEDGTLPKIKTECKRGKWQNHEAKWCPCREVCAREEGVKIRRVQRGKAKDNRNSRVRPVSQ
jgi:hypothetical protein